MKILITAATTARAHQLKTINSNNEVLLGDYLELPAFMVSAGKMIVLPNPASASYTHQMLTICLDNGIECVYVIRPDEARLLTESIQLFREYGIEIRQATE